MDGTSRTNATATTVDDVPALTTLERVGLAHEEGRRWLALLETLPPHEWDGPSGCAGWSVRDLVSHLLGQVEAVCSVRETVRQVRAARGRPAGQAQVDAMTAHQVATRAHLGPHELVAALRTRLPQAAQARRRVPWRLERPRMGVEVPQADGRIVTEKWSFTYMAQVYTRDLWMHRADLAAASGGPMVLTPEHDGRLVADVVRDWAGRHDRPFRLVLTGPAGGRWSRGAETEPVELDAVDFCRRLFGRGEPVPPGVVVPF